MCTWQRHVGISGIAANAPAAPCCAVCCGAAALRGCTRPGACGYSPPQLRPLPPAAAARTSVGNSYDSQPSMPPTSSTLRMLTSSNSSWAWLVAACDMHLHIALSLSRARALPCHTPLAARLLQLGRRDPWHSSVGHCCCSPAPPPLLGSPQGRCRPGASASCQVRGRRAAAPQRPAHMQVDLHQVPRLARRKASHAQHAALPGGLAA